MEPIVLLFQQFQAALRKLKEACLLEEAEIVRDGTIQRFEFTFELAWKLMRRINQFQGVETNTPREAIRQFFQSGLLSENELWFDILKDRNLTSHVYCEETSIKIYQDVKKFLPVFQELEANAKQFIEDNKKG